MGHNIQQKEKKLVTKQYYKKLFVLFYTLMKVFRKFPRVIYNLLKHPQTQKNFLHFTKFICLLPLLGRSKN